jgi:3-oxoacyl-[acyl-carrier protein] reductase
MRHDVVVSIAIVGGEVGLVGSLAGRLDDRGTTTVTVAADSSAGIETELRAAADVLGATPVVLRIGIVTAQGLSAPLLSTSVEDWTARAERPLRNAFQFHQAAARFLADRGGRVIVVLPTTGLNGAAGFTALATAAEGERSLAKAQARISGAYDVTVNCIAVASTVIAATDHDLDRGGLPPHAVAVPDLDRLAGLITVMCGDGFAGVTGQTIALDGGRWMAP